MKNNFLLVIILLVTAFAKAQTVNVDLLLQTKHETTTIADITGTPQNGMLFFDTATQRAYVYSDNQWRRIYYAPIILPKTGNYILTPQDDGNVLTFDSVTDITLTIPSGLEEGFNVSLYQLGSGRVTIIGAGGVSVLNRLSRFRTAGPNAGAGIICTATSVFHVTGDLKK